MQLKAYAKINLSLDVIGKRNDGYHLLKMIMQNIDLYDEIDIEKIEKGIIVQTDKIYIPDDERNLAYKAAKLFIDSYNISEGVKIIIKKNIPVAAGLAGGSSDAATVLRCMRELFEKDISNEELMELSLKIGSDIPYCIIGGTALCEGIGEIVTPLKTFKNKIVVIVKPNFGLSTKEVYKDFEVDKVHRHPNTDKVIEGIENDSINIVAMNLMNLLENVSYRMYPILRELKKDIKNMGALGSLMSGSGPTMYGLFEDKEKAIKCYEKYKSKYNEVYITKTI
ncbi:4-(cytidine 5'-diphospho)-2-C-methyl-D-erythritol kinase [Clostridium sp. DL1XJH146]